MAHLFEPLTQRGVTLRNRIGVSPMCMYSAQDGFANDWHLVHLGARAAGGVGLVMVEATGVEARGRISPFDVGLWSDAHIEPLARVARFVASQGAVPAVQLAHAGRKAGTARPWDGGRPLSDEDGGWQPVGASPIPFSDAYRTPTELSREDIRTVQAAFVAAAVRAHEAGFGIIELHGAHGYLMHSFLSPISNQRTDDYGGGFENRTRFLLETVRLVRQRWPEEKPLWVRISSTDWLENGWTIEESIELARLLKPEGVDLIDCSSGGIAPGITIPAETGYQVPFAEQIRHATDIATAAVGLITDAAQADKVIRCDQADVILLGRQLLRDPHWALHAARILKQPAPVPPQYLRAFS